MDFHVSRSSTEPREGFSNVLLSFYRVFSSFRAISINFLVIFVWFFVWFFFIWFFFVGFASSDGPVQRKLGKNESEKKGRSQMRSPKKKGRSLGSAMCSTKWRPCPVNSEQKNLSNFDKKKEQQLANFGSNHRFDAALFFFKKKTKKVSQKNIDRTWSKPKWNESFYKRVSGRTFHPRQK